MAKLIIKLINDVADIVNNDVRIQGRLKLVFVPNYGVSVAENIIPAADLSEQISTAGTEASGTGNMKLALNGALTIGTLDGANVEIASEVGADNIFIFGLTAGQVAKLRASGYRPADYHRANGELRQAIDMIGSGYFSPEEPGRFNNIVDNLLRRGDPYLLLADYAAYVACQKEVEAAYRDQEQWLRKVILNVAMMGKFSSDRTVLQYAQQIWRPNPCCVEAACQRWARCLPCRSSRNATGPQRRHFAPRHQRCVADGSRFGARRAVDCAAKVISMSKLSRQLRLRAAGWKSYGCVSAGLSWSPRHSPGSNAFGLPRSYMSRYFPPSCQFPPVVCMRFACNVECMCGFKRLGEKINALGTRRSAGYFSRKIRDRRVSRAQRAKQ